MKKFKLIILFLTVFLCFPILGLAEEEYDLWVSGIRVTESNKNNILQDTEASISFNSSTNTLTLNNAIIEKATGDMVDLTKTLGRDIESGEGVNKIYRWGIASSLDNLNIIIKGKNRIGNIIDYVDGVTDKYDYDFVFGIRAENNTDKKSNLIFSGDGELTIYDAYDGIKAHNITFNNDFTGKMYINDVQFGLDAPPCAITATDSITINNGYFELKSINSNGITSPIVNINGGTVKIMADLFEIDAEDSFKISNNLEMINSDYDGTLNKISALDENKFLIIKPIIIPEEEKEVIENPNTSDSITKWLLLAILSICGLIITITRVKKYNV